METIKDVKEFLCMVGLVLLFLFGVVLAIFVISIVTITPIEYLRCSQRYDDSIYKIFGGCMVKYNNKYIHEDLYKESFTKNINLINNN